MQLHQARQEGWFSQQDVVNFGVHVCRKRQIKHRDEGLLDSWAPLRQCVAVDGRGQPLEDGVEQLRVEATDVRERHGSAYLNCLIERRKLLMRTLFRESRCRRQEDCQ